MNSNSNKIINDEHPIHSPKGSQCEGLLAEMYVMNLGVEVYSIYYDVTEKRY